MPNQLPAYKEAMKERGYTVDAIIYIPLSEYKTPDSSTWKNDVEVLIIPAKELIEKWLKPCIDYASKKKYVDIKVILEHYQKLLESLIPNQDIKENMKSLYECLKNEPTLISQAQTLNEMLKKFSQNMGDFIRDQIFNDPKFHNYNLTAFGWEAGCFKIKNDTIYLRCELKEEDAFKVLVVVDDNFSEYNIDKFKELVAQRPELMNAKMTEEAQLYLNGAYRLIKTFNFKDLDGLLDFLKNLVTNIFKANK